MLQINPNINVQFSKTACLLSMECITRKKYTNGGDLTVSRFWQERVKMPIHHIGALSVGGESG
jgi:hypothetical protein